MQVEWAKDNDQHVWIEDLPQGLTIHVFVAAAKTQAAAAIDGSLQKTAVWGTYDIPAIGAQPARTGVDCYRADFLGADLTTHAPIDTLSYILVKEGQHLRVYAELYVRESRAAEGVA
jgi:hypothetical protein